MVFLSDRHFIQWVGNWPFDVRFFSSLSLIDFHFVFVVWCFLQFSWLPSHNGDKNVFAFFDVVVVVRDEKKMRNERESGKKLAAQHRMTENSLLE
jgi:hypothetical protein